MTNKGAREASRPGAGRTAHFYLLVSPSPRLLVCFFPLIVLSLLGTLGCYWAAGPSLGLFFGGFLVATLLAPAAAVSPGRMIPRLIAVTVGIAVVWTIALLQTPDTAGQWALLVLVLAAYAIAMAGVALAAMRLGLGSVIASAVAMVLGLAWLSWPIWLAPQFDRLSTTFIDRLVAVHPPLVANGVLAAEPPWTHRTLAYHLTRLNQDIPTALPTSVIPCVALHLAIGGMLMALSVIRRRRAYGQ